MHMEPPSSGAWDWRWGAGNTIGCGAHEMCTVHAFAVHDAGTRRQGDDGDAAATARRMVVGQGGRRHCCSDLLAQQGCWLMVDRCSSGLLMSGCCCWRPLLQGTCRNRGLSTRSMPTRSPSRGPRVQKPMLVDCVESLPMRGDGSGRRTVESISWGTGMRAALLPSHDRHGGVSTCGEWEAEPQNGSCGHDQDHRGGRHPCDAVFVSSSHGGVG